MILYYVPGACSLANHITLIEAALPHTIETIDRDRRTTNGRDFLAINPKGYVPALELDDGTILTENLAILVYLAELGGGVLASTGLARWRTIEALAFMTSELHGNFKPFFYPGIPADEKARARAQLVRRFGTLDEQLGDRDFLIGDALTIADPYLFVMLRWAEHHEIAVSQRLVAYRARLRARPSVAHALAAEGLA
jgi:glutathione S-transferase